MAASCSRELPRIRRWARHRLRFPHRLRPGSILRLAQSRGAQNGGDGFIELLDAGFQVENSLRSQFGMCRRQAGGDDPHRRLDQSATRLAGHVLQRIEDMPQLAEL